MTKTDQGEDIKKRYGYFWCQILALIVNSYWYFFYGSVLENMPQDYQWIPALFHIYVRDIFLKFVLKVVKRSMGGDASQMGQLNKFLAIQYLSAKHALFLGAIVGGVATPASSLCIMGTDFAKAMLSGWRIVKKYKKDPNVDLEGTFIHFNVEHVLVLPQLSKCHEFACNSTRLLSYF